MGGVPQKPIFEQVCIQYEEKIVGWENDFGAESTPEIKTTQEDVLSQMVQENPDFTVFRQLLEEPNGPGATFVPHYIQPIGPNAEVDLPPAFMHGVLVMIALFLIMLISKGENDGRLH